MLSFFKINDPLRLVPILLLAFLLKLPALLHPVQFVEATHWFVIGEAMHNGSMYSDIWDGLAPFSALLFQFITWIFGRSLMALYILGIFVTFIQAIIINNTAIRAKVFENNTYLPALIYVLFTSSHPAFFTLSPSLMGLTFVLLGLGNLLRHVEFRAKADIQIIMIGLYFGGATLFYFPFIVFLPVSLVLLLLFTSTIGRRYFLLIFGNVFPIIASFFYYWLKSGRAGYFTENFIRFYGFGIDNISIGWQNGLMALAVPSFFMFLGLVSFGRQRRLTNYQSRIVQLFLLFGVLALSMMLLESPVTYYSLVVYMPVLAFFTVHLVSLFKKPLYTTLLSLLLFACPIVSLWAFSNNWFDEKNTEILNNKSVAQFKPYAKNKSIMVLGPGKALYEEARLAGPFYDWELSQRFFNELDYYDNLVFLQHQFERTQPEVIIDIENIWPKVEQRLPLVAKNYYRLKPQILIRKP